MKNEFISIGTMSGTSLDGLDLVLCKFTLLNNRWKFEVLKAETFEYSSEIREHLGNAEKLNGLELSLLSNKFGDLTGEKINEFLKDNSEPIDFIASHGHTVFHQPEKALTLQIGNGANIFAKTGITSICDFRSVDVALGGQGAPLVPIGDKLLFDDFGYCLNLGGFANISFDNEQEKRVAFDICPVNIVLNYYSNKLGFEFDRDGKLSSKGNLNLNLLNSLNNLDFYKIRGPKSLGKEWLISEFLPICDSFEISFEDKLHTISQHIVEQISRICNSYRKPNILVTGGGAFNNHLIKLLKEKCKSTVVVPDKYLINYKEAIIFSFLGLLRFLNKENCLRSVTGASKDNVGGAIY